ncbi:acyltransferase [Aliiglaciecola lipolytica]|uniref:Acyltransferase n=1 Tax=Aliiglaciecola lipolytica E3 TaxID=1127673 RepID=K6YE60_9ALTE|nr:acyltransferase [Aliiglaciecola lipolytica]GAC16447.1 hypothetical protein GLIP_3836 [Aliiglaciecola lipolytica E3]
MTKLKKLFLISSFILPSKFKVYLYAKVLGWNISPSARIGYSLILCEELSMQNGAKIASLTCIKGLSRLEMEESSSIGPLNWITGFPLIKSKHFEEDIDREPLLHIQKHSAITSRHILDCTNKVTIGKYSTFAGFRSQILTHSIDLKEGRQRSAPVNIGDYCFVGTSCVLLPGSKIPNYSILAAGSVLTKEMLEENCLYGGGPAKKISAINPDEYGYMKRKVGFTW